MKKVFLIGFVFCLTSCSEDSTTEFGDSSLEGQWTLTNVSCFCGFPSPPEFENTTLGFDTNANEIQVSSTGGFMYFRENGTYDYTAEGNRITLEDGRSYDFVITDNMLTLEFVDEPNIADDEILYSLVRR